MGGAAAGPTKLAHYRGGNVRGGSEILCHPLGQHGLEMGSPAKESQEGEAMVPDEPEEMPGGDVVRVEQMALLVEETIGLYPPA